MLLQFVSCLVGNQNATKLWGLDLLLIYGQYAWFATYIWAIYFCMLLQLGLILARPIILPRPPPTSLDLEIISDFGIPNTKLKPNLISSYVKPPADIPHARHYKPLLIWNHSWLWTADCFEEFSCLVHKLSVILTALDYKPYWKMG